VDAVHRHARGIPRVTNLLCEHALISAFVDGRKPVPAETVEEVAREFQLDECEPAAPGNGGGEKESLRLMEVLQNLAVLAERLRRTD
jgi:hypothetical protein